MKEKKQTNNQVLSVLLLLFVLFLGTVETAIHFVIYEHFKKVLRQRKQDLNFVDYIAAAGVAKFTASSLCYPHGMSLIASSTAAN